MSLLLSSPTLPSLHSFTTSHPTSRPLTPATLLTFLLTSLLSLALPPPAPSSTVPAPHPSLPLHLPILLHQFTSLHLIPSFSLHSSLDFSYLLTLQSFLHPSIFSLLLHPHPASLTPPPPSPCKPPPSTSHLDLTSPPHHTCPFITLFPLHIRSTVNFRLILRSHDTIFQISKL